jgi:hypothetical protein
MSLADKPIGPRGNFCSISLKGVGMHGFAGEAFGATIHAQGKCRCQHGIAAVGQVRGQRGNQGEIARLQKAVNQHNGRVAWLTGPVFSRGNDAGG